MELWVKLIIGLLLALLALLLFLKYGGSMYTPIPDSGANVSGVLKTPVETRMQPLLPTYVLQEDRYMKLQTY